MENINEDSLTKYGWEKYEEWRKQHIALKVEGKRIQMEGDM